MKVKQHFTFYLLKYTGGMPPIYRWLLIACCLQLAACSPVPSPDKGKMVFRYNEFAGIATLDPAFAKNHTPMEARSSIDQLLM